MDTNPTEEEKRRARDLFRPLVGPPFFEPPTMEQVAAALHTYAAERVRAERERWSDVERVYREWSSAEDLSSREAMRLIGDALDGRMPRGKREPCPSCGCNCDPRDNTGGGHRGDCPAYEPDCTCYESWAGHQPMCPYGVALQSQRERESQVRLEAELSASAPVPGQEGKVPDSPQAAPQEKAREPAATCERRCVVETRADGTHRLGPCGRPLKANGRCPVHGKRVK